MNAIAELFWWISLCAAIVGAIILATTVQYAQSAPQEASGAALAVGVAVIPYVFARATHELVILNSSAPTASLVRSEGEPSRQ